MTLPSNFWLPGMPVFAILTSESCSLQRGANFADRKFKVLWTCHVLAILTSESLSHNSMVGQPILRNSRFSELTFRACGTTKQWKITRHFPQYLPAKTASCHMCYLFVSHIPDVPIFGGTSQYSRKWDSQTSFDHIIYLSTWQQTFLPNTRKPWASARSS